jgi:tol-pal system protein YbgF
MLGPGGIRLESGPMTRIKLRRTMTAAAAAVIVATACAASAQEADRTQPGFLDSLFGGSERFGGGERAAPAAPPAQQGRVAQAGADLIVRLDRLEAQIRQLTGTIEQLQFRNQQLEGQLKRLADDTEYRFQDIKGGAPPRPPAPARPAVAAPPPGPPPPAAAPGRRGDAFDPTQNPVAPGVPRPLGTTAASVPLGQGPEAAEEAPIGVPGGRAAGAPLDLSIALGGTPANEPPLGANPPNEQPPPRNPGAPGAQVATLPPSDSPKDNYDLAYGYLLRKDYALADDGFRVFLRKYPSDRLAPDAQYWLGESLFQRQRFRDAAESFLNVSTKYEATAKAPDALLRLGQSLAALGEKEAACASLAEVARKYPRAAVGVKQGVEREQKRVRC